LQRVAIVGLAAAQLAVMGAATKAVIENPWVQDRAEAALARVRLELRLRFDPPPDRAIEEDVVVADAPDPTPTPEPTPRPTARPGETPAPTPEPTPAPVRKRVDFKLNLNPDRMFASQLDNNLCAPAGIQMVLAMHGLGDTSPALQQKIHSELRRWESVRDAKAGGWGPSSIALALEAYGAEDYEVHLANSRMGSLRDAAIALMETRAPVILIAWKGAHTWVMTGFRADADPRIFPDAEITGAYIYDPWYPRRSTITGSDGVTRDLWGQSDPPGAFQDWSEMQRNFLEWQRPEGAYPKRDGKFITVVPTIARSEQG
jgi:hypothetical protein